SCYVRPLRVVCNAEREKAIELPQLRTPTKKVNLASVSFL
ncbi:MAG: hypothetical protein QOI77_1285, partial [Blastocatellia bacterium]|nr:hypothetical protein [Blastocatellia bacterium]